MTVKRADDVEAKAVAAGKDTTIQVLISAKEGPNFALRRFIMQKGGGMPRHTNTVEHEQYVLRGRATITIGDETHHVAAGDVIYMDEYIGSRRVRMTAVVTEAIDEEREGGVGRAGREDPRDEGAQLGRSETLGHAPTIRKARAGVKRGRTGASAGPRRRLSGARPPRAGPPARAPPSASGRPRARSAGPGGRAL